MRTKNNNYINLSFDKLRMTGDKLRMTIVFIIIMIFAFGVVSAAESVKKDEKYYREQGLTKFKQGKYSEAISNYTKSIKINSKYSVAFLERGLAYYMLNKNHV